MRRIINITLVLALSVALAGCGTPATPCPENSGNPVTIKVGYNPSPLAVGDIEIIFSISDEYCKPIEGATVNVSVGHTDMAGMNMSGTATDQGSGKYSIKANFTMAGNWLLTVRVQKDQRLDYQEDIPFEIEQ